MTPLAITVLLWAQAGPDLIPPDLIPKALNEMRQRRWDAAIGDLNRAVALQPRSAMAHLLLGQAYLGKGAAEFVAQAKAEFQQARELDPNLVLASFYVAKIDLDLGRHAQAERGLRQALAKKPDEHFLLALLGEARRLQGDSDAAIALTTEAIAAGPEAIPVHYYRALAWRDQKQDKRALEDLGKLLGTRFATPDACLLAGAIRFDAGELAEADSQFRQAIRMDPERAELHFRLAQVLRKQRRFDLAMKELDTVEAAPQLSSPYFQKLLADAACEQGLVWMDRGDPVKAKAAFRRALEIDPSHEEAAKRLDR